MRAMTSAGFTELEHLRVRVGLLQGMATHINAGLNVQQMVERTLLEAHKSLPEFRLSYSTVDKAMGQMVVMSSVAPLNMASIEGQRFDLQQTPELTAAWRTGAPIAVSDIEADGRTAVLRQVAESVHVRALLYVPVRHPGSSPGLLGLASPVPHVWSTHEIAMMTDMAGYLAIAIREAGVQQERAEMNRQLRESQKMEVVGRLVGGVAHDFNNLLTGIMIYSGLLSTALGGASPLQRHVREIQAAGERGATLVGQLLSLSRTQVLELELRSLNSVMSGMQEMLQRLVGEEVRVECRLAPELGSSRLDDDLLRQTILNLAVNARDAMPGGGSLEFSTRNLTVAEGAVAAAPALLPGEYAVLSVRDSGTGMSAETLAHCFEPFYTTKALGAGTGLGLAGVYGMVLQHGGYITVKSGVGAGTTFELYFPVAAADAAGPAGKDERGRRRETVLLVEDEEMLRLPLAEQLQAAGYYVLSAGDGDAGLAVAANFGGVIDLLVTDLVMPGMSGAEMAEELAGLRPEMRVLFISGYTNDPRARQLIADGAELLRKPFDGATFARKVRERIEEPRLGWPQTRTREAGAGEQREPVGTRSRPESAGPHPERQQGREQKSISSLKKRDIE